MTGSRVSRKRLRVSLAVVVEVDGEHTELFLHLGEFVLGIGPRPVKWCMRLGAPSSPEGQAAASIAITSSGWIGGGASAFAIDSALM
jgi:hypothetical protein